ncbi:hypothetical protein GCM10023162_18320 [Klenkia terrae]
MCIDALHREESCGGHFRAESQWGWTPEGEPPILHKEALEYEYVHLAQRSYK